MLLDNVGPDDTLHIAFPLGTLELDVLIIMIKLSLNDFLELALKCVCVEPGFSFG